MNIRLLKQDIKNYWFGVAAAVIACVILDRIFGTCCPMRIITGLPCPACGTTRSFWALLRGDMRDMLWYQPLMPLLAGTLFLFAYLRYFKGTANKNLFYAAIAALIIIGISVYLYRIYKYYPERPPLEYTPNNIITRIFGEGENIFIRISHE